MEIPRQKRVNTNILIQENVDEIKQSQDEMKAKQDELKTQMAGIKRKQDEIDSNGNEIKVREELSERIYIISKYYNYNYSTYVNYRV